MDGTTYKPTTNVYRYRCTINFIDNIEDMYTIANMHIKSIAIDYDYKTKNMPMIFVTAAIDRNVVDRMIDSQDKGIMIFNLQRAIINSDMPELFTDYISDKFIYFMTDDINKRKEMDYEGENAGREDLFKIVTFGLLSLECVNKNKKLINGVVTGKLSSILYYLTGHLPILIEPPTDNIKIEKMFIPPMNSVSKSLEYVNSLNVFYTTPYRFFIDFDCAYLLSSSGKGIEKKDEDINSVFITVKNSYDMASKTQGMSINEAQGMYELDCDGMYCEVVDNHISEKVFSKITATGTSGTSTNGSLQEITKNGNISEKTMAIRIPNENTGLVNNMVSSMDFDAVRLLIQKTDIDPSVMTINKEYTIKADEVYGKEDYNGIYILNRKRELYLREDENFIVNVMLLFNKVPSGTEHAPTAAAKVTTGLE